MEYEDKEMGILPYPKKRNSSRKRLFKAIDEPDLHCNGVKMLRPEPHNVSNVFNILPSFFFKMYLPMCSAH